jgi:hypothetical protein
LDSLYPGTLSATDVEQTPHSASYYQRQPDLISPLVKEEDAPTGKLPFILCVKSPSQAEELHSSLLTQG